MDNIINKTNFTGLIALAGMDQSWNSSSLDSFITLYQESILKKALGEHLYNLLIDNYSATTQDKWYKLINGDTYTKTYNGNDYTIRYKGVKTMLANLIYYYYKTELQSQSTETGEVISNNKNSVVSKIDRKTIKAYNLGVELYGEIEDYDNLDYVEIGDLPYFLTNQSIDVLKPSLLNYITYQNEQDNTTYPNWIFSKLEKINEFGI